MEAVVNEWKCEVRWDKERGRRAMEDARLGKLAVSDSGFGELEPGWEHGGDGIYLLTRAWRAVSHSDRHAPMSGGGGAGKTRGRGASGTALAAEIAVIDVRAILHGTGKGASAYGRCERRSTGQGGG